jgi:hypothetical protein
VAFQDWRFECDPTGGKIRAIPSALTNDQVYALTAYILAQNELIDAKQVINAQTLPRVEMPNRNGFIPRFRIECHTDTVLV